MNKRDLRLVDVDRSNLIGALEADDPSNPGETRRESEENPLQIAMRISPDCVELAGVTEDASEHPAAPADTLTPEQEARIDHLAGTKYHYYGDAYRAVMGTSGREAA